jgi:hypothetical protein
MTTEKLAPLKIKCTDSDCDKGLHCFKFHGGRMTEEERGRCRTCGTDIIDWNRVHRRAPDDIEFVLSAMQHEHFRNHMWRVEIDNQALVRARKKGREGLIDEARKRLEKSIGIAQPYRDGRQTPMSGNVIYYAQHATGCCCRRCLEYWHGIEVGRALSTVEAAYCLDLVMRYIEQRLPDCGRAKVSS